MHVYFEPSRVNSIQRIGNFRYVNTDKIVGIGGYSDTMEHYYVHYLPKDTVYKFNDFDEALRAFN